MIDTEIKPGAEISVEDGDLLVAVTDGYGKLSVLRYPLPRGVATVTYHSAGIDVVAPEIRIALYSIYHEVRFPDVAFAIPRPLAVEIAEILLSQTLPDAPHQCNAPGCAHGHGA